MLLFALPATTMLPQVINVRDGAAPADQTLQINTALPRPVLSPAVVGSVSLRAGLFRERRELTKAYAMRLRTENLLQNHLLEAGVRIDRPIEDMHQNWESPHCQLRGHFLGHWLSAVAHFAKTDRDPMLAAREQEVVRELARCQKLNGGEWVGSIPEKFFAILTDDTRWVWSPQYTLHKTMMGLYDSYAYSGDTQALEIDSRSADWYLKWTEKVASEGHGAAIYGGECAGMLELWADLYGATNDQRYLTLASRYAMPDLFRQLLAGGDPLTNAHANASIPWIQGAARLYEVTGDTRYREVVERFWRQAVTERGMFATTGNNAGEYWVPPQQFGRFLGKRTQEHCTVYNMIRVAQYLLRWTGDAQYADYIERALYNGILAQQNPNTGFVSYFLPLEPGAQKKWGTETKDFWCCHGTLVQAQAMHEDLIYYRAPDGVTVAQFIPSEATFGEVGAQIRISQKNDGTPSTVGFDNGAQANRNVATENLSASGDTTSFGIALRIEADRAAKWTLRVRQPAWALGTGSVEVDGQPVQVVVSKNGFIEITRDWASSTVNVTFRKKLTREPLPGDPSRFALLDGPVVLAAITGTEPELGADSDIVPQYEHEYIDGREWRSGHYWVRSRNGRVEVKPLYEVADENYCVYFAEAGE